MGGEHAAMGAEPLADLANIVQSGKRDQGITQGRRDRKQRDQPFSDGCNMRLDVPCHLERSDFYLATPPTAFRGSVRDIRTNKCSLSQKMYPEKMLTLSTM
jgi:hypothetical protein